MGGGRARRRVPRSRAQDTSALAYVCSEKVRIINSAKAKIRQLRTAQIAEVAKLAADLAAVEQRCKAVDAHRGTREAPPLMLLTHARMGAGTLHDLHTKLQGEATALRDERDATVKALNDALASAKASSAASLLEAAVTAAAATSRIAQLEQALNDATAALTSATAQHAVEVGRLNVRGPVCVPHNVCVRGWKRRARRARWRECAMRPAPGRKQVRSPWRSPSLR